jgi:ATP-dependent DNA helicase RecG
MSKLTEQQLRVLLSDLESDRVERTSSIKNTDKFCQAICAFANDVPNHRDPGYLLIGVEDNGKPSGLQITNDFLSSLGAIRSSGNVLPQPAMSVEKYVLPEGEVAVVTVLPADLPPVRYKGRIHIRVGPRKAIASEQEERMLSERRAAHARTFDARYCPEATIEDLSLRLFEEYRRQVVDPDIIEANHRTIEEQLASLRFYDLKHNCPTMAGLLLFGKNPRYFLPGAYVQFLRMPGADLTHDPDDQEVFTGDMRTLIDALYGQFRSINQTVLLRDSSSFREQLLPDYPPVAVHELLLNAIMHRDYESNTPIRFYCFSDRIEISNPGGLYGEVRKETMEKCVGYRNPILAEALKGLGYVNRYGSGIQRAQAELQKNANPRAEFTCDAHFIEVTIERRPA